LRASQPVQRSEIAFQLWADSNEEQALTNLRKALHQIKQTVSDVNLILADIHTLQLTLSQHDRLDIADFNSSLDSAEQARRDGDPDAEQAAIEHAVSLYQGDLLPHCYDEWLIPERDHLRDRFIHAIDRLVALLERRKHYRDAIRYAQQLLQVDRLREETYRSLIRLHALNDDRAAALNVYHVCASVLAKELGVEPDATTQELYERLAKSNYGVIRVTEPATQISSPLVARQQEWNTLIADWKEAARGKLHVTVLSGEAGIGKTRLAEDLVQWAARQGICNCASVCYPADSQISYAPLTGWLRKLNLENLDPRWRRELARLIPEFVDSDSASVPMTESWQKQVFFEAIARALTSQEESLLLFLDDLHWCDIDSLEWLRYFMRFNRNASILLLTTLRTEEVATNPGLQTLLLDLRSANQITEIELSRFSKEQTGLLAAHLQKKSLSDSDVNTLFEESEGVPLFIVEMARENPRVGTAKQATLTPRLRALLEGKLVRLSTPARTVAESAAILGREFNLTLLKKISELDEGTTIAALDELWRRRMVRVRGAGMYDFSHDKLREATLLEISPVRASWLNQRAAEALEITNTEDSYVRIADHFERAGLASKSAEYYLRAAAYERSIFALYDALEHLTRASRLETDPRILVDLHEQGGDVSQLLERREDALVAFSEALRMAARPLQKARLERKRVTLLSRFEPDLARQSYQHALMELEQSKSDPDYWQEWIETQLTWIEASYWQQNANNIDQLLEKIREPVEQYGTLLHKIDYKHRTISSAFVRERYRLGEAHVSIARENLVLARQSENPYRISTATRLLGMVAFCAEQWELSETAHHEAIQLCEKNNDYNSLVIARVYISLTHRRMQRLNEVRADTRQLEATLQKVSKHPQYEAVVHAHDAWLAYRDGNLEQARKSAGTALDIWKSLHIVYSFQWLALFLRLDIAVREENMDEITSYARGLLIPPQQKLAPDVESALLSALETDSLNKQDRIILFKQALVKAQAAGYV
jgi:DNA-binding SARP family transcriptional activator